MRNIKRIAALMAALMLALALSACGGESAPDKYSLSGPGIELDSFTKVVGERGYSGGSTSETQVTASYTGVTNVQEDLNKYREYLSTQGFVDYFGMEDVRAAMVLRRGDDALVFSANNESDTLNLTLNWVNGLELCFGDTQYVSGTSLAILPSNELVIFDYPVLSEQISTQAQVDQLILDGVNQMIQYAAEQANGQTYKLVGNYELTSKLASNVTVNLTGTLTVGDAEQTLTSSITLTNLLEAPEAQYTPVAAQ